MDRIGEYISQVMISSVTLFSPLHPLAKDLGSIVKIIREVELHRYIHKSV